MILTSTSETVPFVAPWREGDVTAPVFHLRAASILERAAMEAELAGEHRAGQVFGYELQQAVREGIAALLAGDPDGDRAMELVAAEETGEISDADKALLTGIRNALADHWPPYRELVAQMERRRAIAPIVALRRFCIDITGPGIVFERGRDGRVADKTLAGIEPLELMVAGNRAYALAYGASAEKNSPPPSSSDDAPQISSSGGVSREAGKSKATAGKRTRASRSPRGAGLSSTSTS